MDKAKSLTLLKNQTVVAFLMTRVLGIPFWALVSILSCILYKDFGISLFHVTIIAALKPISALLAPYWSVSVYQRRDRIVSNLIWGSILRYTPFFLCPWITSPWYIILAFCMYMVLSRGITPAWMEIIKCNIPKEERERVFQLGNAIEYLGVAIVPFILGGLLDSHPLAWTWFFFSSALIGALSSFFCFRIRLHTEATNPGSSLTFKEVVLKPWVSSKELLEKRPDFAHYLLGFMLGGTGLMILHPVISIYFVDVLDLSYTEMLMAIAVCKGVGFALSSPLWVKFFKDVDIYFFSSFVALLAALFPFLLIGASYNISCLYLAFIFYGVMQSGSELSWHMSGPIFADQDDSTVYSGTNILAVGIRGCIVPFIGGYIFSQTNSIVVMLVGAVFCFLGSAYLIRCRWVKQVPETVN